MQLYMYIVNIQLYIVEKETIWFQQLRCFPSLLHDYNFWKVYIRFQQLRFFTPCFYIWEVDIHSWPSLLNPCTQLLLCTNSVNYFFKSLNAFKLFILISVLGWTETCGRNSWNWFNSFSGDRLISGDISLLGEPTICHSTKELDKRTRIYLDKWLE